jgi:hypothetical protein
MAPMDRPDDAPRVDPLLGTARALEVDRVTGAVVSELEREGVRTLLLKGPALVELLYDDGTPRTYLDCDLLVPPEDFDRAAALLVSLGFERDSEADHLVPEFGPLHADPFKRSEDGARVDLHRALSGLRMGGSDVWGAVGESAQSMRVGGTWVSVPRPAALGLIVALHTAHHGEEVEQPLEDLARAIERLPLETWREAVDMADRLHAIPPLANGLRMLPEGVELAERLRLPSAELTSDAGVALGFERLAEREGLRAKAALVLEEIFPSPRFMRWWTPLARRGRAGLVLAYPWRVLYLLREAGPGIRAWRRSRAAR